MLELVITASFMFIVNSPAFAFKGYLTKKTSSNVYFAAFTRNLIHYPILFSWIHRILRWEVVRLCFARGRNNSQHYWPNNVGSCCVRVQNKAARLLSLPLLSNSKMATTRGKIRRNNYIAVINLSLPASHSIIVIDNAVEKMYACSFFPEQTCFSKSKKSTVMLHLFRF